MTGALLVLLVAAGIVAAGRAILLVFIALLLGAALEPLVGALRGPIRVPRAAAILLVYAAFFGLAAGLVLLVVPGTLAPADQLGATAPAAEAIPMVGPTIGSIPALLVAATLRPEVLPFVLVAYLIIHAIEGNVLAPLVVGSAAGISPFLVIASLLVGGAIVGLVGALIAVPVAASLEVVLERLQDRTRPVTQTTDAAEEDEVGATGLPAQS